MYVRFTDEHVEQIGPDAVMGQLLRRFWLPALSAYEVAEAPNAAVYTKLLGEELLLNRNLAVPMFEVQDVAKSYPIVVHDGLVWTFMGNLDFVPTPPDFGGSPVPLNAHATKRLADQNWVHVLEEIIDAPTPFLPPFYTSAFACVPADDTTTWIWSFGDQRIPDRYNDGVIELRRLMIQLARINARGHVPLPSLQGEWYRVAPSPMSSRASSRDSH
jgi:hypothetical protein